MPPFALFGIDFYFRDTGAAARCRAVGDSRISDLEYSQALRQAQDRMREMTKNKPDPSLLNSPQLKESVLDDLIARKVTLTHAYKSGMTVSTAELQKIIGAVEAFRDESGQFSQDALPAVAAGTGHDAGDVRERRPHEHRARASTQRVLPVPASCPSRWSSGCSRSREQEREVSQFIFNPVNYRKQVKISEADVEKYYEEHKNEFQIPERVRLEYRGAVPGGRGACRSTVTDEEMKNYYQANIERYRPPEERRASHILIPAASECQRRGQGQGEGSGRGPAEPNQVASGKFAELAAKYSKDPGSAEKGGDLGFFGRGLMVKPFDDAVFAMKVGEIAGPVETQYGYHIIRLDAIKAVA